MSTPKHSKGWTSQTERNDLNRYPARKGTGKHEAVK